MVDESHKTEAGPVTTGIDDDFLAVRGYLDGLIQPRLTSPVSRDVPLISLGFDSLAAIEVWARLRTDLGVDVPADELLALTLDGLTARVRATGAPVEPVAGGAVGTGRDDASSRVAAQRPATLDGVDDGGIERPAVGLEAGSKATPAD